MKKARFLFEFVNFNKLFQLNTIKKCCWKYFRLGNNSCFCLSWGSGMRHACINPQASSTVFFISCNSDCRACDHAGAKFRYAYGEYAGLYRRLHWRQFSPDLNGFSSIKNVDASVDMPMTIIQAAVNVFIPKGSPEKTEFPTYISVDLKYYMCKKRRHHNLHKKLYS